MDISAEIHLHPATVKRAIKILESDRVIVREIRKRRPTIFQMLREYSREIGS